MVVTAAVAGAGSGGGSWWKLRRRLRRCGAAPSGGIQRRGRQRSPLLSEALSARASRWSVASGPGRVEEIRRGAGHDAKDQGRRSSPPRPRTCRARGEARRRAHVCGRPRPDLGRSGGGRAASVRRRERGGWIRREPLRWREEQRAPEQKENTEVGCSSSSSFWPTATTQSSNTATAKSPSSLSLPALNADELRACRPAPRLLSLGKPLDLEEVGGGEARENRVQFEGHRCSIFSWKKQRETDSIGYSVPPGAGSLNSIF
jgi:hypothetical protein